MGNTRIGFIALLFVFVLGLHFQAWAGSSTQQPTAAATAVTSTPVVIPSISSMPSPLADANPTASPSANVTTVRIAQGSVGKGPAAFGTNPLTISMGTTVTWINDDTVPHTATSDTMVWDSGTLQPGQNYSFKFNNTGTFPYHCTIHGQQSMSGTIVVH